LRGFAFCAVCGRVYTPYVKKGILYYGARCARECTNPLKSFNFDYLEERAGELITKLSFTEEELVEIDARANTDIALLEAKRMSQLDAAERKKKQIREELAYLNGNRLVLPKTGVYTPEGYVAEEARLTNELNQLKDNNENASDVAMRETIKDVILLSELLKNAAVIYSEAEPQEKDKILRVIFSELTLTENTLDYKCKKGFAALQSRFVASCDLTGNRTPIYAVRGRCPSR
jgi:site-specific DNA recombinase